MVFCNKGEKMDYKILESHNPYFNRWFSAIWIVEVGQGENKKSHNPYFNRWFSAI